MAVGAVAGAVATQAVNTGIQQAKNPESFLNQALKYLAIGIMILAILLGLYLVANWGFLKDGISGILDTGVTIGDSAVTLVSLLLPAGLGGFVSFLNPFRRFRDQ